MNESGRYKTWKNCLENGNFSLLQIRKFFWCASPQVVNPHIFMIKSANPRISTKYRCYKTLFQNSPKSFFYKFFVYKNLYQCVMCYICKEKSRKKTQIFKSKIHKLQIRNKKNDWIRKSQIHKLPHLRKVRKSIKSFRSANLWIFDLRNLFADRPPLTKKSTCMYCICRELRCYLGNLRHSCAKISLQGLESHTFAHFKLVSSGFKSFKRPRPTPL